MKNFNDLGDYLKELRKERGLGGIKKVSKVLNIDYSYLSKIETGKVKPSSRLLQDIIQHYSLTKNEIVILNNIYNLQNGEPLLQETGVAANRKVVNTSMNDTKQDSIDGTKKIINNEMKVNLDPIRVPVLYADSVYIKADRNGVVLDFAQQTGPTNEFNIVSRVGLSKDHIKVLISKINNLLQKKDFSDSDKDKANISGTGKVKLYN